MLRTSSNYNDDEELVQNKIVSNLICTIQIEYNPTVMISYGYMN